MQLPALLIRSRNRRISRIETAFMYESGTDTTIVDKGTATYADPIYPGIISNKPLTSELGQTVTVPLAGLVL